MTSIRSISTIVGAGLAGAAAGFGVDAAAARTTHAGTIDSITAGATAAGGLLGALALRGRGRAIAGATGLAAAGATVGAALLRSASTASGRGDLRPGDLLPDGQQASPRTVTLDDGRLRFDSVVGNVGASPLQIALHMAGETSKGSTTQVVYNEDGTGRERVLQGGLHLDERTDHDHLHFDDFVYFQVYKANGDDRPDLARGELAQGVKQSFYITDVQEFGHVSGANRRAADRLAKHGRVDSSVVPADIHQGISVGFADVYGAGLEGQSLDVGTLAPGRYVLRETFDPNDEVLEQNERNNATDTVIEVDADQHVRVIRSELAPKADYQRLADGREVIPTVVASMVANVYDDDGESGDSHPH